MVNLSKMTSRIALPLLIVLLATVTNIFARPHHAPQPYAHPAVLENEAIESQYPSYFKNPFYKTPRVRTHLARHSWLAYGEQPVENRIADAVPRKEIYKLLTHAGLVSRDEYPYA